MRRNSGGAEYIMALRSRLSMSALTMAFPAGLSGAGTTQRRSRVVSFAR